RYVLGEDPVLQKQALVLQYHTAGMDTLLTEPLDVLEMMVDRLQKENRVQGSWAQTAVILRNDLSVRTLEGLTLEKSRVLKGLHQGDEDLSQTPIRVRSAIGEGPIPFRVDLLGGQKTGFFLDQYHNIRTTLGCIGSLRAESKTPL